MLCTVHVGTVGDLRMSPTDQLAAQLRAFFAGQPESLETIAQRCEDELLRMIRGAIARHASRTSSATLDPHEICQYVYLTLLRRRGPAGRPPVQNVLAYLRRLIKNAIHERRRRQWAQRRGGDRALSLDPHDPRLVDPRTSGAASLEQLEFLRQVVKQLTPHERTVVALRVHGWRWREISARLHANPDALRAAYRRAIKRAQRTAKR